MKHAFVVLLLAAAARADTLHVPADFSTIQAAVDAAQAGDEIVVAAGTYEETVELLLMTGITLRGQGKVVLHGGDADTAVLFINGCTDTRIERLRFEQPAFAAIEVVDGDHVTLSRCLVEDSVTAAVRVHESTATAIERLKILRPGDAGVDVLDSDATLIFRCLVEDGATTAIRLNGTGSALVERCQLIEPEGIGLDLALAQHASALRNLLVRPGLAGITITGDFATVRDNKLIEPSTVGVLVDTGSDAAIVEDNRVVKTDGTGVDIRGNAAVVRNNRLVKPGQFGIRVIADAPVLTDNDIIKPGDGFILEGAVLQGLASHNRILQPVGSGWQIAGTGVLLHDNVSLGAGLDGFFLITGPNTLIRNEAKGSGLFDLQDSSGAANVFVDNEFGTTEP